MAGDAPDRVSSRSSESLGWPTLELLGSCSWTDDCGGGCSISLWWCENCASLPKGRSAPLAWLKSDPNLSSSLRGWVFWAAASISLSAWSLPFFFFDFLPSGAFKKRLAYLLYKEMHTSMPRMYIISHTMFVYNLSLYDLSLYLLESVGQEGSRKTIAGNDTAE